MIELGQRDILVTFAKLFHLYKIQHLLTGSLAVSYYGYPRATHDIDFVLEVPLASKRRLVSALSSLSSSYLQDIATLEKRPGTLYSLYHADTGIKVDLWLVTNRDFVRKWQRRKEVMIDRQKIPLLSAEDLILTKLSWCKEVMSERHMRDCVGIWNVQKGKLDEDYLFHRARSLRVYALLVQVMETREY